MDFPDFDGDGMRRLLDDAERRGGPEAVAATDHVIQYGVATLLAAQQAAIDDARASFADLDAARRTRDAARIAQARDHAVRSYERARGLSREVDAFLRQMLMQTVSFNRSALPQLQAAAAANMASTAELELLALSQESP
ncbi:MAG: hypothetical protein HOV79_31975 [Hamadaea sp.]|nr:hypothetical protein [Hamadaea sp.]